MFLSISMANQDKIPHISTKEENDFTALLIWQKIRFIASLLIENTALSSNSASERFGNVAHERPRLFCRRQDLSLVHQEANNPAGFVPF